MRWKNLVAFFYDEGVWIRYISHVLIAYVSVYAIIQSVITVSVLTIIAIVASLLALFIRLILDYAEKKASRHIFVRGSKNHKHFNNEFFSGEGRITIYCDKSTFITAEEGLEEVLLKKAKESFGGVKTCLTMWVGKEAMENDNNAVSRLQAQGADIKMMPSCANKQLIFSIRHDMIQVAILRHKSENVGEKIIVHELTEMAHLAFFDAYLDLLEKISTKNKRSG